MLLGNSCICFLLNPIIIILYLSGRVFARLAKISIPFFLFQSFATPNIVNFLFSFLTFIGLNISKSIPLFIVTISYFFKYDFFTRFANHSEGVTTVSFCVFVKIFFFLIYSFFELSIKLVG